MGIARFFSKDNYKNLFLLIWMVVSLVQAAFTELLDDEAYYWVYSRHLDWGYYDHPPMVALLIKAGYALFANELGVRLFTVILSVLTLEITYRLLPEKNNRLFYLILLSAGFLQIGGIFAVPDVPLIFFGTVYFWVYRSFLQERSWKNTLLLGLSMALMFYSKYHGVLLVFFTVLSYPALLRSFRFYAACLVTTLLYFPHLYWQYTHDFPSLQYQLVGRNAAAYKLQYTIGYILGQIVLFGPLAGWLLLYYAFVCPIRDKFERALKFTVFGVLAFFLFSSFKGRVEANWTLMIFPPLVVLAHQGMLRKGSPTKHLYYMAVATVAVFVLFRVYLVWNFVPGLVPRPELHNNRSWADSVHSRAGDRPVVFLNSYQRPSKYMFYTGRLAYSLNSRFARRSQYNYWDTEKQLWGKEVMVAFDPHVLEHQTDSLITDRGTLHYFFQKRYYSYSLIELVPDKRSVKARPGEKVRFTLQVRNGYGQPVPEDSDPGLKPGLGYGFMQRRQGLPQQRLDISLSDALARKTVDMEVTVPDKPGDYQLKFCVFVGPHHPTHNSPTVKVTVE